MRKTPRRNSFSVRSRKKRSTMFSHEQLVWGEVHVEARVAFQPALDQRVFVSGVVIDDQLNGSVFLRQFVNDARETQPFLMAMAIVARRDNAPIERIERGEQSRCSVPLIVMGHRAATTFLERQTRLNAVQGLYLALLIDAQNYRMLGWIQIEADNVGELLGKLRIGAHFESARQMGLRP